MKVPSEILAVGAHMRGTKKNGGIHAVLAFSGNFLRFHLPEILSSNMHNNGRNPL